MLCLEFYDCLYDFIALGSVNSSPLKIRLIFCTFRVAYASVSVSRGLQCLCSLGTYHCFIWRLRNLLFTNSVHLYILLRFHVFLFSSLVIQINEVRAQEKTAGHYTSNSPMRFNKTAAHHTFSRLQRIADQRLPVCRFVALVVSDVSMAVLRVKTGQQGPRARRMLGHVKYKFFLNCLVLMMRKY